MFLPQTEAEVLEGPGTSSQKRPKPNVASHSFPLLPTIGYLQSLPHLCITSKNLFFAEA